MKVKDVIKMLNQFDPELEILCYNDYIDLSQSKNEFRLFEINGIKTIDAEINRRNDDIPTLKFGKTSVSQKYAIIDITMDF